MMFFLTFEAWKRTSAAKTASPVPWAVSAFT